jgi:transcription initiation factor TFIID subunit TAF12
MSTEEIINNRLQVTVKMSNDKAQMTKLVHRFFMHQIPIANVKLTTLILRLVFGF